MADTSANDRRIARNTAFMYLRMFVTMGVSVYTSRVVLDMLGVANYGIYNIVGGILIIFSFLNGTMAGASQRFLNYEMGCGDAMRVRHTFSSALFIHVCIAALVLVLGETVGLWFVNHVLVIAPERLYVANVTYQLSLVACMITILQVPFAADILANEKMDMFAILSLATAFLKLGVALLLAFVAETDTLVFYAAMMLAVTVIVFAGHVWYSLKKFPECSISVKAPRSILRGMLGYSGSDIVGTMCYTLNVQGVLVILNKLGGTVLNAAGGLVMTVSGALSQFGTAIVSAFRPQIIKQYAAGDFAYFNRLIVNCARFSFLLMGMVAVPAIIEMDYILAIWLKEVPAFTAVFARLAVITAMFEVIRMAVNCGIHATGRMFWFSLITGGLFLLALVLMYVLAHVTGYPQMVYGVQIAFTVIILLVSMYILKRLQPQYEFGRFALKGILVPVLIVGVVAVAAYAVANLMDSSFLRLMVSCGLSVLLTGTLTLMFGIDGAMRRELLGKLRSKFGK